MTDITYEKAAAAAPTSAHETARKSLWRLIFDAMIEARRREADRVVKDFQDLTKRS